MSSEGDSYSDTCCNALPPATGGVIPEDLVSKEYRKMLETRYDMRDYPFYQTQEVQPYCPTEVLNRDRDLDSLQSPELWEHLDDMSHRYARLHGKFQDMYMSEATPTGLKFMPERRHEAKRGRRRLIDDINRLDRTGPSDSSTAANFSGNLISISPSFTPCKERSVPPQTRGYWEENLAAMLENYTCPADDDCITIEDSSSAEGNDDCPAENDWISPIESSFLEKQGFWEMFKPVRPQLIRRGDLNREFWDTMSFAEQTLSDVDVSADETECVTIEDSSLEEDADVSIDENECVTIEDSSLEEDADENECVTIEDSSLEEDADVSVDENECVTIEDSSLEEDADVSAVENECITIGDSSLEEEDCLTIEDSSSEIHDSPCRDSPSRGCSRIPRPAPVGSLTESQKPIWLSPHSPLADESRIPRLGSARRRIPFDTSYTIPERYRPVMSPRSPHPLPPGMHSPKSMPTHPPLKGPHQSEKSPNSPKALVSPKKKPPTDSCSRSHKLPAQGSQEQEDANAFEETIAIDNDEEESDEDGEDQIYLTPQGIPIQDNSAYHTPTGTECPEVYAEYFTPQGTPIHDNSAYHSPIGTDYPEDYVDFAMPLSPVATSSPERRQQAANLRSRQRNAIMQCFETGLPGWATGRSPRPMPLQSRRDVDAERLADQQLHRTGIQNYMVQEPSERSPSGRKRWGSPVMRPRNVMEACNQRSPRRNVMMQCFEGELPGWARGQSPRSRALRSRIASASTRLADDIEEEDPFAQAMDMRPKNPKRHANTDRRYCPPNLGTIREGETF